MGHARIDRRRFLQTSAAVALTAPWVSTSRAAGALSVGFWDHWVPGANEALVKLCQEWAAREKVDLKIDFITSQGNKILLTIAAEAQARAGHDILAMATWRPGGHADMLEPVDDVMGPLIAQHGKPEPTIEYLGRQAGHWVAVPTTVGTQVKGPCARIDLLRKHAGIDLPAMYPAGAPADRALSERWTWEAFLVAAEKCHKAGFPFGIGFGTTADSVDSAGALFAAHGAQLVDTNGRVTVDSEAVRAVLDYARRLAGFMPADVFAWDDASNNKWLISGKGALIMNPPSAWAVARRDNPQVAEQLWTFPAPKGPKGRFTPFLGFFWGIWKFSKNKAAAKSLLLHLSQRSAVERLVVASSGFDIPPFPSLRNFPVWAEVGPPKGTLYHYPPRGDEILSIPGAPAPSGLGLQMYSQALMTKMIARYVQMGEPANKVIAWAGSELEGMLRT